jgi:hypothetical protein
MDRLVRRDAFMPFSAPVLPTPFPPTSLGMAPNHATDLVPPQVRESAFHFATFLPSSHFITLRRLLASAPQTVQSSFSYRDRLLWNCNCGARQQIDQSRPYTTVATHAGAHMVTFRTPVATPGARQRMLPVRYDPCTNFAPGRLRLSLSFSILSN